MRNDNRKTNVIFWGALIAILVLAGGGIYTQADAKMLMHSRRAHVAAGDSFVPSDLGTAKLKGWWKPAADTYTHESGANATSSDDDVIAYCGDQSGNGNHIIQAVAANKPTLQNEAGDLINGHPVMRCDGTDGLQAATVGASLTGNFYAAMVLKTTENSNDIAMGWGDATDRESRGIGHKATTGYGRFFGFNADVVSTINVTDGSPHIIEIWSDGTNHTVSIDNVTTTDSPSLNAYTTTTLSVGQHNNGGYDFVGDIAEALVGANLTAANMTSVRTYLNDRFSVY